MVTHTAEHVVDASLAHVEQLLAAGDISAARIAARAATDAAVAPIDKAAWLLRAALIARAADGITPHVEQELRAALTAAEATEELGAIARAAHALGETLLDRAGSFADLQESVRWHQRAERAYRSIGMKSDAALCLLNTGVAYLSMGGGASSLKPKIAAQCLSAALADLDRAEQPELWCSAAMNLANALQQQTIAPDASNLIEAAAWYHEVLDARPHADAARGRVLANLGCVLAKLGRFDDATTRLNDAIACFGDDPEAVDGVRQTLAELHAAQARATSSTGASATTAEDRGT